MHIQCISNVQTRHQGNLCNTGASVHIQKNTPSPFALMRQLRPVCTSRTIAPVAGPSAGAPPMPTVLLLLLLLVEVVLLEVLAGVPGGLSCVIETAST